MFVAYLFLLMLKIRLFELFDHLKQGVVTELTKHNASSSEIILT